MRRVLIFDGDRERANSLNKLLAEKGFAVHMAESEKSAHASMSGGLADAAVIDVEQCRNASLLTFDFIRDFSAGNGRIAIGILDQAVEGDNCPECFQDYLFAGYSADEGLFRLSKCIGMQRREQSLKSRYEKLNILFDLKGLPFETAEIRIISQKLVKILVESFRAQSAAVYLKDEDDKLQLSYVRGPVDREDMEQISRFITKVAMVQKNILIYSDLSREEFWIQNKWNYPNGIHNICCIPLETPDRIIGTVQLFNVPGCLIGDQQNPDLIFLGQVIREAERAFHFVKTMNRQKKELQFAVDELSILYEISNALTSTLNLDEMLMLIVRNAKKSFSAQVVSLMMVDDERKELSIRFAEGLTEEIIAGARMKIGEGVAGRVAQSGEPLLLVDMMGIDSVDLHKDVKSALSVPLKIKDEVIGVLNVSKTSRYQFTETDLKLLYNMASLGAQAIEKASLYEDIKNSLEELKSSYMSTVKALSKAIEAKDPYTQGHVDRVAKYGLAIAMQLDPSIVKDEFFRYALILHDVGKIEIPDTILNKSGALNDEEMAIMRRHPEAGAQIIKPVKFLRDVADMVRFHQERYDGKGYPKGLKGEEIPLIARIISVADAFDAITSDRPYRKAKAVEDARQEISKHAGTQFDPKVVDALALALDKKIIP